jgi:hypothetical protein
MLKLVLIGIVLGLGGCTTATQREARDDASCANARDYAICRQGIMSSRRDAAILAQ